MESRQIQTMFFAILFLLLFIAVAWLLSPFFTVILWSVLLYILFSPFFHRFMKNYDDKKQSHRIYRKLLASLFSVGTVVLFVVPLSFVTIQLARQISSFVVGILRYFERNPDQIDTLLSNFTTFVNDLGRGLVRLNPDSLKVQLREFLMSGVGIFVRYGTETIISLAGFLIGIAFMVFTLYFFYMDGDYLLSLFVRAIPIRIDYMKQLVQKFSEITRNLFLGYILVALMQAIIAFVIFIIFGIDGALLFATLLFFTSFIPMIGAGTVWFPLGVSMVLTGHVVAGIVFLILCGVFISTLDNFLRPLFLKDRIKLHPLIIFFSILGGVAMFGFNGLILGPVIVIFFLTVLDLFLLEHGMSPER